MGDRFDIAIVGAGMAGASLAARLAGRARVVMLEAETAPGYHATGRSAAFWTESYGGPGVQPLTSASGAELRRLGVLRPRGALTIARGADADLLASLRNGERHQCVDSRGRKEQHAEHDQGDRRHRVSARP